jgi:hypothetical protein
MTVHRKETLELELCAELLAALPLSAVFGDVGAVCLDEDMDGGEAVMEMRNKRILIHRAIEWH